MRLNANRAAPACDANARAWAGVGSRANRYACVTVTVCPALVGTVGVFRDEPLESFAGIVEECPTRWVQLHGDESERLVRECGAGHVRPAGKPVDADADLVVRPRRAGGRAAGGDHDPRPELELDHDLRAVVVDRDAVEQRGARTSRAHRAELVPGRVHGLLHVLPGVLKEFVDHSGFTNVPTRSPETIRSMLRSSSMLKT